MPTGSSRVPDLWTHLIKHVRWFKPSGVRYLEANACWRSTVVVVFGSCAMAPRCRLGSYAMTPRAYHRWGDALAVQRASTLEPNREADPGQSGHLSVRQAARIHPRGSALLSRRAHTPAPSTAAF